MLPVTGSRIILCKLKSLILCVNVFLGGRGNLCSSRSLRFYNKNIEKNILMVSLIGWETIFENL